MGYSGIIIALRCLLLTTMLASPILSANSQDADPTAALVDRARRYAEEYEQRFSAMVGEESQVQRLVTAVGATKQQRDLVSDILLVKVGDRLQFFRDVLAVDAKVVRDRDERLRKLFLGPPRKPLEQAGAIYREGIRYDLRFPHVSAPVMLPVEMLRPGSRVRLRFTAMADGVAFEEIGSPTLIRSGSRSALRDMPLRGQLQIEGVSGAVRSATLRFGNNTFESVVDLRYAEEPAVGMPVPVQMKATYRRTGKPKADHMEVVADYSNFRRFDVAVREEIEQLR